MNDQLIGGFLSVIQTITTEIFDQTLDRIKLKEHTILIRKDESLQACYVFKGQSYSAQQKLSKFINGLKENTSLFTAIAGKKNIRRRLSTANTTIIEKILSETIKD